MHSTTKSPEQEVLFFSKAPKLSGNPLLYAAMVATLLSGCALQKSHRDSNQSPQALRNNVADRPQLEITDAEIQQALTAVKKEGISPLVPEIPEIQEKIRKIGSQIHTDISLNIDHRAFDIVLQSFEQAIHEAFPNNSPSHFEIELTPLEETPEGTRYCRLGVFICGHSYSVFLHAKDGRVLQMVLQRVLAVSGAKMAASIQQKMRHDFLMHVKRRIALFLPDSIDKINESHSKKIQEIVEEDAPGFAAIGSPLQNVSIIMTPEDDQFIVAVATNGIQGDCLRFFFNPKDLSQ